MPTRSQTISVNCPACKQPFAAEVHHIIDVKENPNLRWKLLGGQLNAAACPHCGVAGILGMPFAYHDPDKELLLIFMPNETGLSANDQQKMIGSLTQEIMAGLPPEQRKGYLLQPKTFMLLDSLISAILEADGITQEMIEAQQERSRLINELQAVKGDQEKLKEKTEANKEKLDYEFYQTLTAMAGAAADSGNEGLANALLSLRAQLLKIQAPGAQAASQSFTAPITREELLNRLLEADDEREFEALVAISRPAIDYSFYLHIADKIEAARKEGREDEAKRLQELRERLLDLVDRLDAETQKAVQASARLLSEILKAEDPAGVIEERIEEIDDLFFYILSANIEKAASEKSEQSAELVARLQEIAALAGDALEERMPPRLRLINRMLRAENEEERARVLEESDAPLDQETLQMIDGLVSQFTSAGEQKVVERLRAIRELLGSRVAEGSQPGP